MRCFHGRFFFWNWSLSIRRAPRGVLRSVLRRCFGHSDPGMEDALHDNIAMRRFARLEAGYAPDERDDMQVSSLARGARVDEDASVD